MKNASVTIEDKRISTYAVMRIAMLVKDGTIINFVKTATSTLAFIEQIDKSRKAYKLHNVRKSFKIYLRLQGTSFFFVT